MSQASSGRSVMVTGRIVWASGDLFKGKQKLDMNTKQPRRNAAGEIMMEYGFGLAVPKSELGKPGSVWEAMTGEAMTLFPNGQIPPSFAMKFKDGDTIDDKGVPFSQREGYAGHIVLACTTSLPIKYFRWENGANTLVSEGIKCGDYVNVQLHIKAHPAVGTAKAGLYLNPNAVQFLGYGKEIVNAPSGDQIFGNAAPPMPVGASAMPLAPQGATPLVPTGAPMPQMGYAAQPQPMAAPAAPAPYYGVVPPAFQPPPGGQPMAQPQPMAYPQQPPMAQPQPMAYPQQPTMPPMPGIPR